ncbi:MAG: phosphate signaling complex protein PhoU [Acidobacteriia bacterium]|nr:phosphate signaling complex protein PhoU [Terriglobia bacterium]
MHRHFEEELSELKQKLLSMGSLVERSLHQSIKALIERDAQMGLKVFDDEEPINRLQIEIDDRAMRLLALQQPMAGDLRLIASVVKINNDLERIGDQCVNITQRVLSLMHQTPISPLIDMPRMAAAAEKMLHDALDAFVNRNADLARTVLESDDTVDHLRDDIFQELVKYMSAHPEGVQAALDLLLISRNIERIADHATNIAEDAIFVVAGRDVRHHMEETSKEK